MKSAVLLIPAIFYGATVSQADVIAFEAESGTLSAGVDTFSEEEDVNASGGKYITTSSPAGNGDTNSAMATYSLNVVTAGDHTLYVRHFIPAGNAPNDDSFYVPTDVADGFGNFSDTTIVKINDLQNGYPGTWVWLNAETGKFPLPPGGTSTGTAPTYPLSTGAVEFTIRGREDGLLIDALVLSDNPAMTTEELNAAIGFVPELKIVSITPTSATTIDIAWTGGDGTSDIEASSDLGETDPWAPILSGKNTPETVTVDSVADPKMFFRVVEP